MNSLDEQLSALASGDLPPERARALRDRIEREPEVAAAWERMQQLVADLDALPADHPELSGPPVVVVPAPTVRRRSPLWGGMALLAAVALGFVAGRTTGPPDDWILAGDAVVDGDVQLMAADVPVSVDGRARISVEPVGGSARVEGQEREVPMNRSAILAGLAGAAVTVTVYEGTALVHAGDEADAPLQVRPGEPVHVRGGAEAARRKGGAPLPVEGSARDAALEQRVEELQAELAAIEGELQTERFGAAVARGQLKAEQGEVSEWPDEVPDALREETIREQLVERLAGLEGFDVEEVDCYEFPCVVALRYDGDDDSMDWGHPVADEVSIWADASLDDANVHMNQSVFREDDKPYARFVLFAVDDGSGGEEVGQRTKWRIEELGERLGDDATAGE
jgi:anti-sigma factor RsiW